MADLSARHDSFHSVGVPILDRSEGATAAWFTPRRMLVLLCVMYSVVYLDRGLISTNGVNGDPPTPENPQGTGIQGHFGLSNAEDGLISSMFMVGLMVASPIFSEAVHCCNAFRLVGIGLLVWCMAVAACALSWNFASILIFRSFVGVGEAAIVAMAGPFIDDMAPPETKTLWLAWLYLCIPLGYALGYAFGGIVSSWWTWRGAFVVDALLMLPSVFFCLIAKPVDLRKKDKERGHTNFQESENVGGSFLVHVGVVLRHPVLILTCVGYTLYTALVGVMGYWGPKAAKEVFNIDQADVLMGIVTAITGVGGTLLGGIILDWIGSTMTRALYLSAFSCIASGILLVPCFLLAQKFSAFVGPFIVTCTILFLLAAPVNAVILWSVPADQRALATSFSVLVIHALGDVPSPTVFGVILDYAEKETGSLREAYRIAMSLASLVLIAGGIIFLVGGIIARRAKDYRPVSEIIVVTQHGYNCRPETPLLASNGSADL